MLVNKRINSLGTFVSTDNDRESLHNVCVTKKEVVVTDGHILITMPVSDMFNCCKIKGGVKWIFQIY